eukprot:129975-Lingulodinium_polyedra.AAC.1
MRFAAVLRRVYSARGVSARIVQLSSKREFYRRCSALAPFFGGFRRCSSGRFRRARPGGRPSPKTQTGAPEATEEQ